jgi:hypothetical protein
MQIIKLKFNDTGFHGGAFFYILHIFDSIRSFSCECFDAGHVNIRVFRVRLALTCYIRFLSGLLLAFTFTTLVISCIKYLSQFFVALLLRGLHVARTVYLFCMYIIAPSPRAKLVSRTCDGKHTLSEHHGKYTLSCDGI